MFGAVFTKAEEKAIKLELQRQLVEYERKHLLELEAIFLWRLHEKLGFGAKRLYEFYKDLSKDYEDLLRRYEMDTEDGPWLCTQKLKEIGVDLEHWEG